MLLEQFNVTRDMIDPESLKMLDYVDAFTKKDYFFNNQHFDSSFDLAGYIYYNDWEDDAIDSAPIEESVDFIMEYIRDFYTLDFLKLFDTSLPFPYPDLGKGDYALIRYFHKSLYSATRKGKPSPFEAWKNKELVYQTAMNRLRYVGRCLPSDIIQGFNVAKIAPKVSIFKPSLAERLIKTYLHTNDIFDPFSGFSGRLLGATKLGMNYIGQDINEDHVKESNEIINYKNISDLSSVVVQDILKDKERVLIFASLFTCPPYGGKEHWNENNDEVEKTCDEWIDICMQKYKCKEYLFVVDTTEKYKDKIVETITNSSHLGKSTEYVLYFC